MDLVITDAEIFLIEESDTEKFGVLRYDETETTILVTSIQVDEALRGQGIAGKLMEQIVKLATTKNKHLEATCTYAISWINKRK